MITINDLQEQLERNLYATANLRGRLAFQEAEAKALDAQYVELRAQLLAACANVAHLNAEIDRLQNQLYECEHPAREAKTA